ncbi:hypothetical protein ACFL2O_01180 [Thermodesulfobacteriota bacterium]
MIQDPDPKNNILKKFLFGLYNDKKSGIAAIVDEKYSIKLYLESGLLIHAEGLSMVNAKLIYQVRQVKGLDSAQSKKLMAIGKRAPHALGKFLVEKGLMKKEGWQKFLIMRARYHVEAVVRMEAPEYAFSETSTSIPEDNKLSLDFINFLVFTIREIEDEAFFSISMPNPSSSFEKSKNIPPFMRSVKLNSKEKAVLSEFEIPRTIEEASSSTSVGLSDFSHSLYLLLFLGLISPAESKPVEEKEDDYSEIINLYLDFFHIIENNFRKDLGREFEKVFDRCIENLTDNNKTIFQSVDLFGGNRDDSVKILSGHISEMISSGESPLILPTTFNSLMSPLISSMRRLLGIEITTHTLNEMIKVIGYVKKFKAQDKIINYVEKNLQDYLFQLG